MKTKRISTEMEKALDLQMGNEAYAAQVYLSLGSWCEAHGYPGISDYLYKHANEERNHMMKFLKYINARGGETIINAIPAPNKKPKNLQEVFEFVVMHEFENTQNIYKLVNLSHKEGDWVTYNFAQWFVQEQMEEETLVLNLLDKFKLADKAEKEIYSFDRDLSHASQEVELPRNAKEG